MSLIIRDAVAADIPALADLHVKTWNATYPHVERKPTYEIRERQWREFFARNDERWFCLVVEAGGGELIGFASGRPYDHPDLPEYDGELRKIFLLAEYQRRGLGRRLVGHVVRRLLAQGVTSMLVFAEASNPACRFYEALEGEPLREKSGAISPGNYGWHDLHRLAALCPVG